MFFNFKNPYPHPNPPPPFATLRQGEGIRELLLSASRERMSRYLYKPSPCPQGEGRVGVTPKILKLVVKCSVLWKEGVLKFPKSTLTVLIGIFAAFICLLGCGGGGGGAGGVSGLVTLTGRIIWIQTGGAPTPSASVQVGTTSTLSASSDGRFTLSVPAGSNSILVLYQPPSGPAVSFRFDIPAVQGNTNVGDLVIGPEQITVTGVILRISDGINPASPIDGATVELGGRRATTNASGIYRLEQVAYSTAFPSRFLDIEGRASKAGFITKSFFPTRFATSGIATLEPVELTPESTSTPPPPPFNIEGFVLPAGEAPGSQVTLFQSGIPVRRFSVGGDGRFTFYVLPGSYVLRAVAPSGKTSPDTAVTLSSPTDVLRRDVTVQ